MNIENFERLIAALVSRTNLVKFQMNTWFSSNCVTTTYKHKVFEELEHTCGTAACLAGHAAIIAWKEDGAEGRDIQLTAARWLALSTKEADHLFLGDWAGCPMSDITKRMALKHLRNMVADARAAA